MIISTRTINNSGFTGIAIPIMFGRYFVIVSVFSTISIAPTAVPKIKGDILLHVYAAIGAAITPPIIKGMEICHKKFSNPKVNPKVRTIETVTKNSDRFTEPTTYLTSFLLAETKVVVQIGPQPPPPIASKAPPIKPKGNKNFFVNSPLHSTICFFKKNFKNILTPSIKSIIPIKGLIETPGTFTKKYAPIIPPMIPVNVKGKTIFFSTFPNLRCDIPENKLANISAVCTDAETIAGSRPADIKKDDEETPKPIPRAPSMYCAKKPIISISRVMNVNTGITSKLFLLDFS